MQRRSDLNLQKINVTELGSSGLCKMFCDVGQLLTIAVFYYLSLLCVTNVSFKI